MDNLTKFALFYLLLLVAATTWSNAKAATRHMPDLEGKVYVAPGLFLGLDCVRRFSGGKDLPTYLFRKDKYRRVFLVIQQECKQL